MNDDYKQLILDDDIALACEAFTKAIPVNTLQNRHNGESRQIPYRSAYLLSDGSWAGEIAKNAILKLSPKHFVNGAFAHTIGESVPSIPGVLQNTAVFLFADATEMKDSTEWVAISEKLLSAAAAGRNNRCVAFLSVPEPTNIPDGVSDLAEREYDAWIEQKAPEGTKGRTAVLSIQNALRTAVQNHNVDVILIRGTNLIGPGCDTESQRLLNNIVNQADQSRSISVTDEDSLIVRSWTVDTDAIAAMGWALLNGSPGHIYNIASTNATIADWKIALHKCFPDRLAYSASLSIRKQQSFRCLSTLKANGIKWKNGCFNSKSKIENTIAKCACLAWNLPFSYLDNISIYGGRLPRIKTLEMDILREIDRICVKHNIKYFLAGGTMLGAIRYGHSIPWDDDLDIGFLRDDFNRFRAVCDKELGKEFVHSCYYNGSNSHYVVDKIRLCGTYFSTNYSAINPIEDGVFVDLLVYDATSSIKPIAFLHDKICSLLGYIVTIHWWNLLRSECRNSLFWGLYKFVRLIPISMWQWVFERAITRFHFKKKPDYVIDSTGKCIGSGTMRFPGLEDVRRVPFDEGFNGPIPIDPTNYLTYAYGPSYIQEPPYCKRVAPHNFSRIDLGAYLFDDKPDNARGLALEGELYETNHPKTTPPS